MQLLVSAKDVENYKTIKDSLDELRLLVEKSELWVYKAKKSPDSKKAEKNQKKSSKDHSNIGISLDSLGESVDIKVGKKL